MSIKVLIADDDFEIEIRLQFQMEKLGYTVMTAHHGEFALDMIYRYRPDLILLDNMLPGINGYEICEIVRLSPNLQNIKIIILIDQETEDNIITDFAFGVDAYIKKPFIQKKIANKVNALFTNL